MADQLIYFADPMCSWCWGFAPVMRSVSACFADRLPLRVVLGGLAAGATEPLDEAAMESIRGHWVHVAELTGQPFDFGFFERDSFVYDSEPSCRAVVAARRLSGSAALGFLEFLQGRFYAHNDDVTDRAVLAGLATEYGFDHERFAAELDAEDTRQETLDGFRFTRTCGIDGYPSLLAGDRERGYSFITLGYQPWRKIEGILESWLASNCGAATS